MHKVLVVLFLVAFFVAAITADWYFCQWAEGWWHAKNCLLMWHLQGRY